MSDSQHQASTNSNGNTAEICFESRGTRLYAFELGSGPPLVFMHGLVADHRAALPIVAPRGCGVLALGLVFLRSGRWSAGRGVHTRVCRLCSTNYQ